MAGTRWVKPIKGTRAPRHLVSVAVEHRPVGPRRDGQQYHAWAGGAAVVSHYRYGRWSVARGATFDHGAQLIDWVEAQAEDRTTTWVVAPIASYALTLAGMWERWEGLGVKWSGRGRSAAGEATTTAPPGGPSAGDGRTVPRSGFNSAPASHIPTVQTLITNGNPDIIRYGLGDRRLCWVSGQQYLDCTEDALADMIAAVGRPGVRAPHVAQVGPRTLTERATLWLTAMQRLMDWWRRVDGGAWASTRGQLSMSYFRRRLDPKTLLSHQEDAARELEERGVFGGRIGTWYYGWCGKVNVSADDGSAAPPAPIYPTLEGDLEHWDIRSMYPTILAREYFPERPLWHREHPPVDRVLDELRQRCVIADVMIETETPDYPYHDLQRVRWPIGRFRTVLAGPELERACRAGHVVQVLRSQSYRRGKPFAPAATSLLALRQEARLIGDPLWESFVKGLSNSFGGKMAQKKHEWTPMPHITPMVPWGEWAFVPSNPAFRRTFQSAAGLTWERGDHKHKGRPLAACFVYLTAYGRDLMHQVKQAIPADRLVSMDTDGVWVRKPTPYLWQKVRSLCMARGYTLARTGRASAGRWLGPRHYWTTQGWVLAGYHEPRIVGKGMTVRHSQTHIPAAGAECDQPSLMWTLVRQNKLDIAEADGAIQPTGWLRPVRMTAPVLVPQQSEPEAPSAAAEPA